jgi:stage V sporulation protein B
MSNNKFIKGAAILAAAGLFAKFLGIFFKIPLQKLIHDEGMGLFGLPYPIYTIMLAISVIGLPAAVSKLISEKLALSDYRGARKVFRVSLFMLIGIGTFTSCFLYFSARKIIALLNWPPETYYAVVGLAFAPFFVSIMSAFRGYFQGMQIMLPTALSQIVEQTGRVVIGVGLAYIYIEKGIGYAAGGASFGATAGAFLGAVLLLVYYLKTRKKFLFHCSLNKLQKTEETVTIMRRIIWLAIPITIGAVLSSVMGLIDSIIVPGRLLQAGYSMEEATVLFGRLMGKAVTLMNVPLTFSIAMAASLVPAISHADSQNNMRELREKANAGIKATVIIALPAALGLSLLASPIIHLLWGKTEAGGEILKVLALNVIFISLAQTMTSILQGIDKVFIPVRNLFLGVIVKTITSYFLLVTSLNILGAVVGSIIGYFTVMLLNYLELNKRIQLKISIKDMIIKPLFASIVMVITVWFIFNYIYMQFQREKIAVIIAIFSGIFLYFTIIGTENLTRIIKKELFLHK